MAKTSDGHTWNYQKTEVLFQVYPEGNEDKKEGETAQTGSWTIRKLVINDANT